MGRIEHAVARRPGMRWLAPAVALLAAVVVACAGAVAWSGAAQTLAAIVAIGAVAFVAGTLLASVSYALRFARWQLMLRCLGHRVPHGFSARVYLAGLALSPTPAKLGETLRSALLLPRGVPLANSLAAFFADRLSDVVGVAALGAAAGWLAGFRQPVLEAVTVLVFVSALAASLLLRSGRLPRLAATLLRGQPPKPWLAALAAPARAWARLWTAPHALGFALVALLAFGLQGLVFGAYVQAVAPQLGLLHCVAIFASATLIGAASLIPAGLGAMEAALTWQLTAHGVGWPQALAAVLAARASTLWFGTALGALMLASLAGARPPAGADGGGR